MSFLKGLRENIIRRNEDEFEANLLVESSTEADIEDALVGDVDENDSKINAAIDKLPDVKPKMVELTAADAEEAERVVGELESEIIASEA